MDDSDAALAKRVPFWRDALRDALCTLSGNIVIDVPRLSLLDRPPRLREAGSAKRADPTPIADEDAVTLTSAFLWRAPIRMRQGWVLAPSGESSDVRTARIEALTAWIQSAPGQEIAALLGDGIPYSSLSSDSKLLFAKLCFNPGVQKRMASGEFLAVRARIGALGRCTDQNHQPRTLFLNGTAPFLPSGQVGLDRLEAKYTRPEVELPSRRAQPTGSLDLAKGELLTIGDVAARASTALGKPLVFDSRLAKSYVYVQGRFTEGTFLEYMKAVTKLVDWAFRGQTSKEARQELKLTVQRVLPQYLDLHTAPPGISYADILGGRAISLGEVLRAFPDYNGNDVYKMPDSTVVQLGSALQIVLFGSNAGDLEPDDPPGSSPTGMIQNTTYLFDE
jgi:hypothetical protein